jgi:hypothetical protein
LPALRRVSVGDAIARGNVFAKVGRWRLSTLVAHDVCRSAIRTFARRTSLIAWRRSCQATNAHCVRPRYNIVSDDDLRDVAARVDASIA